MREVKRAKQPSQKQIMSMLHNLQEVYGYSKITTIYTQNKDLYTPVYFDLDIGLDVFSKDSLTWEELQNYYFELINKKGEKLCYLK